MTERPSYNPQPGRLGSIFQSLDRSLGVQRGILDIRRTADSIQKNSKAADAVAGVVKRIQAMHPEVAKQSRMLADAVSYGIVARSLYTFFSFGQRGTPTILDSVGLGPGGMNTTTGILAESMYLVLKELPNRFQIASEDFLPPISKEALQNDFRLMLGNRIPDFSTFINAFTGSVVPISDRSAVLQDAMIDAFVLGFMRAGNPDDDLMRGMGGAKPPLPPSNPSDKEPSGVPGNPRFPLDSAGAANQLPEEEKQTVEVGGKPSRR